MPLRRGGRRRATAGIAALVAGALLVTSCGDAAPPAAHATPPLGTPAGSVAATSAGTPSGPPGSTRGATAAEEAPPPGTTSAPRPVLTTVAPVAPLPPAPHCAAPAATPTVPARTAAAATAADAIAPALDVLIGAGSRVSVSVWADGLGPIAEHDPALPLVPASNQKLLVAVAAFELFAPTDHVTTTLVGTGPVVDGELRGDLVLVAGGDPLLEHSGGHSLDALTAQLKARGIRRVTGHLLVDESRYATTRTAPGWPDALWPTTVGPLTAFPIDHNRVNPDPAFFTDPALVNASWLTASLAANGVTVAGPAAHGTAPAGEELARLDSAPLTSLAALMLTRSDNLIAELLLEELGRRRSGTGSTSAGLAAAREVAAGLCVTLDGHDSDGSGLSSTDARAAGTWRRLLTAARERPWFPAFRDGLAHAGQSGTLAARLQGPATVGRVQAKTGSTALSRALSGYLTTASGRPVVFSIVVNGPGPKAEDAIDAFVTAVALV